MEKKRRRKQSPILDLRMNETSQSEIELSKSGRRTSNPSPGYFLGEGGQTSGTGGIGDKGLYRFRKWQEVTSKTSDNEVGLASKERLISSNTETRAQPTWATVPPEIRITLPSTLEQHLALGDAITATDAHVVPGHVASVTTMAEALFSLGDSNLAERT
jgi:hypothetical protein